VSTLDERGLWPNAPTGFLQRIAIIGGWTWIAMLALHLLRTPRALTAGLGRQSGAQVTVAV